MASEPPPEVRLAFAAWADANRSLLRLSKALEGLAFAAGWQAAGNRGWWWGAAAGLAAGGFLGGTVAALVFLR